MREMITRFRRFGLGREQNGFLVLCKVTTTNLPADRTVVYTPSLRCYFSFPSSLKKRNPMRIEGRTRTGTSKIIFQVCREAKVNRERGLSGRRRATLKMRRRRTETFSLSSSLTFTVSFFWKKKNRLRENRDELTNVSVKPLGDSLTLCPIIRAPPQKKTTTTQKLRWTFGAAIFNKNGGFFSRRWPCWTWRNIIWYKWMMTAPFVGPKAVSRRLTISLDDDDYRELPFFSRTQLALASFVQQ